MIDIFFVYVELTNSCCTKYTNLSTSNSKVKVYVQFSTKLFIGDFDHDRSQRELNLGQLSST